MNFRVVFSGNPVAILTREEGIVEFLKSDIKAAFPRTCRNEKLRSYDRYQIRWYNRWLLRSLSLLSIYPSLSLFLPRRFVLSEVATRTESQNYFNHGAVSGPCENASGVPINKFPRGDFRIAHSARAFLSALRITRIS